MCWWEGLCWEIVIIRWSETATCNLIVSSNLVPVNCGPLVLSVACIAAAIWQVSRKSLDCAQIRHCYCRREAFDLCEWTVGSWRRTIGTMRKTTKCLSELDPDLQRNQQLENFRVSQRWFWKFTLAYSWNFDASYWSVGQWVGWSECAGVGRLERMCWRYNKVVVVS